MILRILRILRILLLVSATATLEPAAGCAKHADLEAQTLLGGAPTNETFDLQIS